MKKCLTDQFLKTIRKYSICLLVMFLLFGSMPINIYAQEEGTSAEQGLNQENTNESESNSENIGEQPSLLMSASSGTATNHTVTIAGNIENGSLNVDKTSATEGEDVIVTISANQGYELDNVDIYEKNNVSNKNIPSLRYDDTTVKFCMPSFDVTVTATFKVVSSDSTFTVSDFRKALSHDATELYVGKKSTYLSKLKGEGVSISSDNKIKMYHDGSVYYLVHEEDGKIIAPSEMSYMLGIDYNDNQSRYASLKTIIFGDNFDTSNVTKMNSLFYWCTSLKTLDISYFDTSNVTNMSSMFSNLDSIETIDISSFNTEKVSSFYCMFSHDGNLKTIYGPETFSLVSKWDDAGMFLEDKKLEGGRGTKYDSSQTTSSYAHNDEGTSNPGYFTSKVNSHIISIGSVTNGTLNVVKYAAQGSTVTITVAGNSGYQANKVYYNDGVDHELIVKGNTCSFVMPDSDVTLHATFVEHPLTFLSMEDYTNITFDENIYAQDDEVSNWLNNKIDKKQYIVIYNISGDKCYYYRKTSNAYPVVESMSLSSVSTYKLYDFYALGTVTYPTGMIVEASFSSAVTTYDDNGAIGKNELASGNNCTIVNSIKHQYDGKVAEWVILRPNQNYYFSSNHVNFIGCNNVESFWYIDSEEKANYVVSISGFKRSDLNVGDVVACWNIHKDSYHLTKLDSHAQTFVFDGSSGESEYIYDWLENNAEWSSANENSTYALYEIENDKVRYFVKGSNIAKEMNLSELSSLLNDSNNVIYVVGSVSKDKNAIDSIEFESVPYVEENGSFTDELEIKASEPYQCVELICDTNKYKGKAIIRPNQGYAFEFLIDLNGINNATYSQILNSENIEEYEDDFTKEIKVGDCIVQWDIYAKPTYTKLTSHTSELTIKTSHTNWYKNLDNLSWWKDGKNDKVAIIYSWYEDYGKYVYIVKHDNTDGYEENLATFDEIKNLLKTMDFYVVGTTSENTNCIKSVLFKNIPTNRNNQGLIGNVEVKENSHFTVVATNIITSLSSTLLQENYAILRPEDGYWFSQELYVDEELVGYIFLEDEYELNRTKSKYNITYTLKVGDVVVIWESYYPYELSKVTSINDVIELDSNLATTSAYDIYVLMYYMERWLFDIDNVLILNNYNSTNDTYSGIIKYTNGAYIYDIENCNLSDYLSTYEIYVLGNITNGKKLSLSQDVTNKNPIYGTSSTIQFDVKTQNYESDPLSYTIEIYADKKCAIKETSITSSYDVAKKKISITTSPITAAKDYYLIIKAGDVSSKAISFSVDKKEVTITANDAKKNLGENDPSLDATIEGLCNGDSVDYELNREAGETTGSY